MNIVKGPDNQPEERIRQMIQTYEKDLLRLCRVYVKDAAAAIRLALSFAPNPFETSCTC